MKTYASALMTCLLLASTSSAHAAVEAQKVADALAARLADFGFVLKVTGTENQGDNVMLKGVSVNVKGEKRSDEPVAA